jgi:transcriptional regulator with XRE-family HTH domain
MVISRDLDSTVINPFLICVVDPEVDMNKIEKDALSIDVGGRLRDLRQGIGISMRALARMSGLSANALSMIERGRTSPSVSTLYKLSSAMGIPITAFFREEPQQKEMVFCKASERTRVPFMRGLWEGLGGESFLGRAEPFMLTLESGASSGPFGIIHTGYEFVFCMRGQILYEVENQNYTLEQGDSLLFGAELRHRWRNPGKTVANVLVVLSGFSEDEHPSEFHISSAMVEQDDQASDQ